MTPAEPGHRPQPLDAERRTYSRCAACATVVSRTRRGVWRHDASTRARILAGPVWEYAGLHPKEQHA